MAGLYDIITPGRNGKAVPTARRYRVLCAEESPYCFSGELGILTGNFRAIIPFYAPDGRMEYSGELLTARGGSVVSLSPSPTERRIIDDVTGYLSSVWGDLELDVKERENNRFPHHFLSMAREWFSGAMEMMIEEHGVLYQTAGSLINGNGNGRSDRTIRKVKQPKRLRNRMPGGI